MVEEEWSQIAGVRELMAQDKEKTRSNPANASQLKRPRLENKTFSRFSADLDDISSRGLDEISNMSGLTVLNEGTRQPTTKGDGKARDDTAGMGLMARVLANSGSRGADPKSSIPARDNDDQRPSTSSIQVSTPGRKPSGGGSLVS